MRQCVGIKRMLDFIKDESLSEAAFENSQDLCCKRLHAQIFIANSELDIADPKRNEIRKPIKIFFKLGINFKCFTNT